MVLESNAVAATMDIARSHAASAAAALDGAERLDRSVCAQLSGLVENLVTRAS